MDFDVVLECDKCKNEVGPDFYNEKIGICNMCICENSFQNMYISGNRFILSIDIGIKHLALVLRSINENYDFENIVWFDLVDITKFDCKPNCTFFHSKTFADWIRHFIDNYEFILNKADYILIERQPPQGLVAVEQLLYGCFREKSILISPTSVHKFFGIKHLDYDNRKIAAVNLTSDYFKGELYTRLSKHWRKHDICDAVLFTLFWIRKEKDRINNELLAKKRKESMEKYNENLGMSMDDFFNMYRYIPRK